MKPFGSMVCCKPGRQMLGMACEPGHMVLCLAERCAALPPAERRQFSSEVASVDRINRAGMQPIYRAAVERNVKRRAANAGVVSSKDKS